MSGDPTPLGDLTNISLVVANSLILKNVNEPVRQWHSARGMKEIRNIVNPGNFKNIHEKFNVFPLSLGVS